MNIPSKQLLDELAKISDHARTAARGFLRLNDHDLNHKQNPETWSILECLEHLNLYGDYYLPEIKMQMDASDQAPDAVFKSGLLGNYFANAMKAKNGKIKKMRSPKDKIPVRSGLSKQTIHRFLLQLDQLDELLHRALQKNLVTIRISISLNRHIRIRLGDTFRFYVYHIERHVAQANRAVAVV